MPSEHPADDFRDSGASALVADDHSRHRHYRLALPAHRFGAVRLVIARCSVDYDGRLTAHLPLATRLLVVKADGSVLVHSDGGSHKPLNWMSPPCTMAEVEPDEALATDGVVAVWRVQHAKSEDRLT